MFNWQWEQANMKIVICICHLLLLDLLKCVLSATDAEAATSGPYKSTIVRVQECDKTTYPIDKDPPMTLTLDVYNTKKNNLIRGNLTVTRDNRQVKIKLKSFVWRDGKWKLTYLMNNIGCHGALLHMLTNAMGIKYDREKCGFIKGSYSFKDIDTNSIQHIWASRMEYGRILWTSETTTMSTTYYCWEFETLVEPLEN